MLLKNLIWISKMVGKSDQGREAIHYSVPLPTQARFVVGARNNKWLPYSDTWFMRPMHGLIGTWNNKWLPYLRA